VFFLAKDLMDYVIHYLLHYLPWLWTFHKLHHTIQEMDWIGNFRFHWMELVIYYVIKWLPLVLLGVDQWVILTIGVISTLVGNLNHTNVRLDWGPLKYVLNSPRLHLRHHDYKLHGKAGQNFAVVFRAWDWLFRTAYFPRDRESPERLGFPGMKKFPRGLLARITFPVVALPVFTRPEA
jgi:sterol desaturase/sphingolipid hydroxylase (fatty acid hydroxylase superfamily)